MSADQKQQEGEKDIDYGKLADAVAKANVREQESKKQREAAQGIAFVVFGVAGILIGFWSGRWWAGLLTFAGSIGLSMSRVMAWPLGLLYAGGLACFAWLLPNAYEWSIPIWGKLLMSLFGGLIGAAAVVMAYGVAEEEREIENPRS